MSHQRKCSGIQLSFTGGGGGGGVRIFFEIAHFTNPGYERWTALSVIT